METENKPSDETKYKEAKERVEQIRGFYTHLFVYIFVNTFLLVQNLIVSPKSLWFYWVTIGWGIGVAAHAFSVFGVGGLLGKDWEERKIKKLMGKDDSDK